MADPRDDLTRRSAALDDRSVLGAAPLAGGPTMASPGAYETPQGDATGGARDFGDSAGDLRPATSRDAFSGDGMAGGPEDGVALAHEVFGSDEDTNPDQLSAALRRAEDERG
jgi:hypothetical protein